MTYKYIGKRIFFLKNNGTVILEVGEMEGWVVEPEKEFNKALEEAYKYYAELSKYNKEEVDFIDLEFGEYETEFAEMTSYKIDIATRKPIFDYTPIPDPPDTPKKPTIHERMDVQENTNNEQDELIISNAANIAIMLEATGADAISTFTMDEDRELEKEKNVDEKSVLFNVLKRSIENGANIDTTKKRIELFKRIKQLTEEEATELLAMLA